MTGLVGDPMNLEWVERLSRQLQSEEGCVLSLYRDTTGHWTIGVGRNLTSHGITRQEALYLLANDIQTAVESLDRYLPWWREMDPVRQLVLADMCFNMGISSLLTFKYTLLAMQNQQWKAAASGMKASKWALQVGGRAIKLATMMEMGIGVEEIDGMRGLTGEGDGHEQGR